MLTLVNLLGKLIWKVKGKEKTESLCKNDDRFMGALSYLLLELENL